MRHPKIIIYNGRKYRILSTGKYYQQTKNINHKEVLLHRAIWMDNFGEIPKGMCVHHKNFKWWDNRIENLELMERVPHSRLHMKAIWRSPKTRKKLMATLPARLSLAAVWHRSEEGLIWHRKNGKRYWENLKPKKFKCIECGVYFSTKCSQKMSKHCSTKCYSRSSIRKHKTLKRLCKVCGLEFFTIRSRSASHCSRSCAAVTIAAIKLTNKKNGGTLP
jgi:hypothetical protein